jgi:predicted  nucleic acid-binding Zn-ribbon protein
LLALNYNGGDFIINFSVRILLFQFDLEQKVVNLEQKIVNLEQEVSRLTQQLLESKEQVVSAGLDQDKAELRQEVQKLKQDLEDSRVREQQLSRELSSSPEVTSPVLEKLKVGIRDWLNLLL